jgi:hypothetical protein
MMKPEPMPRPLMLGRRPATRALPRHREVRAEEAAEEFRHVIVAAHRAPRGWRLLRTMVVSTLTTPGPTCSTRLVKSAGR